jgi:mono/diheme cytochrome c family protein
METKSHSGNSGEHQDMRLAGMLAEFDSPEDLIAAAEKVRDQGFKKWDCFTPFPVHGLDDAMGIRISYLPGLVLAIGLTGFGIAIFFQCWANGINYPWNISGKPLFSFPAFFPITFEFTVLLSAFTCFFGVLLFNQLPQFYHPTFRLDRFRRATDDKFFLYIEAHDPKFHAHQTRGFLESLRPAWLGECEEPALPTPYPGWVKPAFLILGLLLALPPMVILALRGSTGPLPRVHIVQDMDFQVNYRPQSHNAAFADGRSHRPPAVGVVAIGESRTDDHFYEGMIDGQLVTSLPKSLTIDDALMLRGEKQYRIHCSVCHGLTGDGQGMVHRRAMETRQGTWVPPLSFHDARLRSERDGHLFNVITNGIRSMPAYGYKVPAADRWAIVLYIRALQRSQDGTLDDVPPDERERIKNK